MFGHFYGVHNVHNSTIKCSAAGTKVLERKLRISPSSMLKQRFKGYTINAMN